MAKEPIRLQSNNERSPSYKAWISIFGQNYANTVFSAFGAPFDGVFESIHDLTLAMETTGTAGTVALDVKINNVTIFTTKPSITSSAASRSSTGRTGTGITRGVLKSGDALRFSQGDAITVILEEAVNTAGSPTGVGGLVGLTRLTDHDVDMTQTRGASDSSGGA